VTEGRRYRFLSLRRRQGRLPRSACPGDADSRDHVRGWGVVDDALIDQRVLVERFLDWAATDIQHLLRGENVDAGQSRASQVGVLRPGEAGRPRGGAGQPRGRALVWAGTEDTPPRFGQISGLVSIWLAGSHLWHSSKRRSHAGERRTAAACWSAAAPETCGDRECGRDPASSLLPYTSLKVLGAVPASNLPWSSRAEAGAWLTQGVRYGTAGASREGKPRAT